MTDEHDNDQSDAVVVEDTHPGKDWVEYICLMLNTMEPAKLLMWSALAIFLAAVCTYFGIQMQYGLSDSSMLGLWQTGEHVSFGRDGGRSPLPPILGKALASFGFVFGIVGTLLPMWTVGRLISDSIKVGAMHE